jgi:hypothetical protein
VEEVAPEAVLTPSLVPGFAISLSVLQLNLD